MNIKDIKVGSLITTVMLRQMDACPGEVLIFKREWPDGMRIRKKNLFRAAELGLNVNWFAAEIYRRKEHSRYWDLYLKDRTGSMMGDAALSLWEVIRERGGK